jgi:signal recognition particle receptor subunit beta
MVSLETETDRTLFFDLLPLDVGVISGMKVRLQLYTVPGQVFYNATRKLVLKGVDGIVFVADSQASMLDSNLESLRNLEENLRELGIRLAEVPLVFQYNKRDIRHILSVERLNQELNAGAAPHHEAAALHGVGVFETLKAISRLALTAVRRKVTEDRATKAPAAPPAVFREAAASPLADLVAAAPPPGPARAAVDAGNPLAALVGEPHGDVRVEFAEEDTDKHVRPVATKAVSDVGLELEKLRASTAAGAQRPNAAPARDVERRLQDMLASDNDTRQEIKRKLAVEVPAQLLRGASRVRIHLGFETGDGEELVRDAAALPLVGNRRLERLLLRLDVDLKAKG